MIQCCFPALYRLVNKAHLGQQAVDRSSALVTADIFKVQSFLTKRFLEQISKASMHERDNLRQWRRVIQLNTHPRYTASSTLFTKSAGSMLCTSEWWTFVVTLFPIYCVIDTLMSTLLFYSPPPLSLFLSLTSRALWSKDECREMCWQLDPTEGPGRVRRRMMRAPLTIPSKHILSDAQRRVREGEEEGGNKSELL